MVVGTPSVFDLLYLAVNGNDIIRGFEKYDDALIYEKANPGVDILCCRDDMVERFYEKNTNRFRMKFSPDKIRESWKVDAMLKHIFQGGIK